MLYNGGFWGMHLIWWFIWMGLIFWIFATPYSIPGQRYKRDTAFDILRKRFAAGELTMDFIVTKVGDIPVKSVEEFKEALSRQDSNFQVQGVYPDSEKVYYYGINDFNK